MENRYTDSGGMRGSFLQDDVTKYCTNYEQKLGAEMINAETQSREDAEKIENLLSEQVIDAAIEVHRTFGISNQFWARTTHRWLD